MGSSFPKYHYERQLAMYSWILCHYCRKEYDYNKEWTFKTNVIAVETRLPCSCQIYVVNRPILREGIKEFNRLIKMVAYYTLFGFETEVEFI